MKKQAPLTLIFFLIVMSAFCQRPTLELGFTARDNNTYVKLDSIKIKNLTDWDEITLVWPDTVLILNFPVGVSERDEINGSFRLLQNYPNPVREQTFIEVHIPEKDAVSFYVTDILGRILFQKELTLDKGSHTFRFNPPNKGILFFAAHWRGQSNGIKILNLSSGDHYSDLEYVGNGQARLKSNGAKDDFIFRAGDVLLYIGYSGSGESGMMESPVENKTYTLQFGSAYPCPETPTVEYEGQVYNTVQIFSQCWLKENLNTGEMIPGTSDQTDNGIIEKYCYNNEPDSCSKYGGLYQWDELMQYSLEEGVQGICPPGWHIPTDDEWKVLEGVVDSQYQISDAEWNGINIRGFDAGDNLKSIQGWSYNGNGADKYGFAGLPAGRRNKLASYEDVGDYAFYWTSSDFIFDEAYSRVLINFLPGVIRSQSHWDYGFSVRCLRD